MAAARIAVSPFTRHPKTRLRPRKGLGARGCFSAGASCVGCRAASWGTCEALALPLLRGGGGPSRRDAHTLASVAARFRRRALN